jgi:hypothetical protein
MAIRLSAAVSVTTAACVAAASVGASVTVTALAMPVDVAQDLSPRCCGYSDQAADGHPAAGLHGHYCCCSLLAARQPDHADSEAQLLQLAAHRIDRLRGQLISVYLNRHDGG